MVQHLHLQGWGEPLLHPRLPAMAAAAKAAGCRVGITTNGDLLHAAAGWIVDAGVDDVTVSVGGMESNGANRGGGSFAAALDAAAALAARSGRRRSPRVQLSYMLTRDNAGELEEVVRAAARCGLRDLFAIHLDFTPAPALAAASAFAGDALLPGVEQAQDAAARVAKLLGVRFRPAATAPADMLVCALDPTRIAYVTWDGRVGPCAYLLPPIAGPVDRAGTPCGGEVLPVSYGSVPSESLDSILGGEVRQRFVAPFRARLAAEDEFAAAVARPGFGTIALARVEEADHRRAAALADNPFPSACNGCHKRRGW